MQRYHQIHVSRVVLELGLRAWLASFSISDEHWYVFCCLARSLKKGTAMCFVPWG